MTTLKIVERTYNEHGCEYTGLRVEGYVNGKQVRIRCKDRKHAVLVLSEQQGKAINSERSNRYLPTRLSVEQLNEAETIFDKLGKHATLTEVFEFWHAHNATAGEQVSLEEAILRYLRHEESRVRGSTWEQKKQCLNRFAAAVGEDSPIVEVTHQTVLNYLDGLKDKDGGPASNKYWNNVRIVLHAFFGWTTERPQQFTAHNIVGDIRAKQKEHGDIQTLTHEQAAKLMEHVSTLDSGKYARHFALALFAGIRPEGELQKLQESDIDLEHNVIKIRPEVSKVHRFRQITIQPNLRKWLVKFSESPLAITEHAYRKVKGACAPGHDILRHTFCSNHLHVSGSFAETAIESGNSEKILKDHYVNRTTKVNGAKFWAIRPA